MLIVISLTMIYFKIHKKEKIIDNTGYVKYELVLFGLFLFFLSFNFNKFSNYSSCVLNFITKHCGILIIYNISLIYISVGHRLGINYQKDDSKLKTFMNQSNDNQIFLSESNNSDNLNNNDINNKRSSFRETILFNIEKELNNRNSWIMLKDSNSRNNNNIDIDISKNDYETSMKEINKNIFFLHSLFIELLTIYIIFCISFLILAFLYGFNKNDKYIQENDGKWRYECPLNQIDLLMNFIEFFMNIYSVTLALKIWNYSFIFKCTKYICYSSIIMISLGPLPNVMFIYMICLIIII